MADLRVGILGLDTSHSIQFVKRMQAPDCPEAEQVSGMRALSCLRFETPFQDRKGLDERQAQLEAWGVRVTESFDEAVGGVDALLLEINDPSLHLEYFRKAADLGLPLFLDKPLAEDVKAGSEILAIAARKGTRFFSASSLRFAPALEEACAALGVPELAWVYGALGKAPTGSSVVWYGVHAFEMLERSLGKGALRVSARADSAGVVAVVGYPGGRRGVVELTHGSWEYGGTLRTRQTARAFAVDGARIYTDLLVRIRDFLGGGDSPVAPEDTLEVMALLEATERSVASGQEEALATASPDRR